MTDYTPLSVTVVTHRLQGKALSHDIQLAQRFPCIECGAPAGFACKDTGAHCWRARLLSAEHWKEIAAAREKGRGASGGFRDEIYQGMQRMGIDSHRSEAAAAIRWMSKDLIAMVKAVLDADPLQNR